MGNYWISFSGTRLIDVLWQTVLFSVLCEGRNYLGFLTSPIPCREALFFHTAALSLINLKTCCLLRLSSPFCRSSSLLVWTAFSTIETAWKYSHIKTMHDCWKSKRSLGLNLRIGSETQYLDYLELDYSLSVFCCFDTEEKYSPWCLGQRMNVFKRRRGGCLHRMYCSGRDYLRTSLDITRLHPNVPSFKESKSFFLTTAAKIF